MSDTFLTPDDVESAAITAGALKKLVDLRDRIASGHEHAPVYLATRMMTNYEFQMDKVIFKQALDAQIEKLKAHLLKSFGMRVSA